MAPDKAYLDRVTGRKTAPVTTGQIYWGAIPFVLIQIVMVALIIAFPAIVSGGRDAKAKIDTQNIHINVPAPVSTPGANSIEQDDATRALEKELSGDAASPAPDNKK